MSASPGLEQPARVSLSGPLPDTMLQSLALLWELPLATLLLDEHHHIVDINPACAAFTGRPREWLVGRDTLQLHAADDQATVALARERRAEVFEARLLDAQGRERWYRQVQRAVGVAQGHQLWLVTWQDRTAEHAARDRADRTLAEFEAWFDLSPVGMVMYDERGLLVRSNAAFEAVVGSAPVLLDQASAALQELLAWDGSAVAPELQPGAVAVAPRSDDGPRDRARPPPALHRALPAGAGRATPLHGGGGGPQHRGGARPDACCSSPRWTR